MPNNETYNANYFFRDYVTEDILSYCIGEVYIYHFKETLVGVRHNTKKLAYFVDLATLPKQNSLYAPTIEQLTEENIQNCIDEVDHSGEKLERIPLNECVPRTLEFLMEELGSYMDKLITGDFSS